MDDDVPDWVAELWADSPTSTDTDTSGLSEYAAEVIDCDEELEPLTAALAPLATELAPLTAALAPLTDELAPLTDEPAHKRARTGEPDGEQTPRVVWPLCRLPGGMPPGASSAFPLALTTLLTSATSASARAALKRATGTPVPDDGRT